MDSDKQLTVVSRQPAISVYDSIADPLAATERMGKWIAESGLCHAENVAQGYMIALTCLAEKITPIEFMRTYNIIRGQLSKRADAMLADFRKRGGRITWIETTDQIAKADFEFEGKKTQLTYTIEQAKRAKLIKGDSAWEKTPDAMLRARLISTGIRMLCPEINAGYYTPEEIQDVTYEDAKPLLQPTVTQSAPEPIDAAPVEPPDQTLMNKILATGEDETLVNTHLARVKWIKPDQTWRDLQPAQMKLIVGNWGNFIKKARTGNGPSSDTQPVQG